MIDTSKQYTYKGRPVRIYADGSDTYNGYVHGAFLNGSKWCVMQLDESELVEVWQPKEGEWCFFWDKDTTRGLITKFAKRRDEGYIEKAGVYWDNCAPFTGELPEAFKGL